MRILTEHGPTPAGVVAEHVALPPSRSAEQAFVRCNMITSADGGSAVAGVSGGLGNRDDHAVFAALRETADVVLVGMSTVLAEHYHEPSSPDLQILVIAATPDISGDPELFASGRATLVLPSDAPPAPPDIPTIRAGAARQVDLQSVVASLAGKVVVMEGGPTLAGLMVSLGLVDEFFMTIAPRLIVGDSARIAHGPAADPTPWELVHGFVDEQDYLFLRYSRIP